MNAAQSLRQQLTAHTDSLKARLSPQADVIALIHERAAVLDRLLVARWQQLGLTDQLALIAVGGYGRGELHPYSDIDLLILADHELTPAQQDSVSQFITDLWDARLDVGHATRTLDDCLQRAEDDITIATNLLEARLLSGPKTLFAELKRGLSPAHCWPTAAFFEAKVEEQHQRHRRFDSTSYNLEPNLKSNPGGLRDIQTVVWVLLRHLNRQDLPALAEQGWLEQDELDELILCRDFLWRLRFALHLAAGRSEERLLFDLQPEVARQLGFGEGRQGVETMMQQLYQTLRRVIELNSILLQVLAEEISPVVQPPSRRLDPYFESRGNLLFCTHPEQLKTQKPLLLVLFLHMARDSNLTGIGASTLRALRAARRTLTEPLCQDPLCRQHFVTLIRHKRGMGRPFQLMHQHGIMAAYLPAWQHIVGQMQFDLFHAYTVDEHTYRVVRNAYRFSQTRRAEEFPLASTLVRKMRKPELLYLAALFHDIAKGRGGDHSEQGAAEAMAFGKLHGLDDPETRLVAWLVEHHLVMSVTAQRRDISDPEVIRHFATLVRDETHLDYLYCLTVADIRATNDKLWNDWKGTLLRELYYAAQKALRRGLEKPVDIRPAIRNAKTAASKLLARRAISHSAIRTLWRRFRVDYFLRHSPEQIAWHAEAIIKHQNKQTPLVKLSKYTTRGGTELFIYTRDRAQVFACIASILDAKNLSIHDAQVMTSKDGWALDSLVVVERDGGPVVSPSRVQSIRRALEKALAYGKYPKPAQRPLPRQLKPFNVPTEVTFLPSSRQWTLAEFVALDQPGLLAQVGQVFAELAISLKAAKITTIGERAEDFFILTANDGHALSDDQQQQLRQALVDALDRSGHNRPSPAATE